MLRGRGEALDDIFPIGLAHLASVALVRDSLVVEVYADQVEIRNEFGKDNALDAGFGEIRLQQLAAYC